MIPTIINDALIYFVLIKLPTLQLRVNNPITGSGTSSTTPMAQSSHTPPPTTPPPTTSHYGIGAVSTFLPPAPYPYADTRHSCDVHGGDYGGDYGGDKEVDSLSPTSSRVIDAWKLELRYTCDYECLNILQVGK